MAIRFYSRYRRIRQGRRHAPRGRRVFQVAAIIVLVTTGMWLFREAALTPNNATSPQVSFRSTVAPSAENVRLPQDDAPHPETLTEWWYYNGILHAGARRFGFHYVVFRRGGIVTHTAAHVALSDFDNSRRWHAQRRSGGFPDASREAGFDIRLGDWQMAGSGGHDSLRASGEDFALDLSLEPGPPPVLHGGGLLNFGPAGESYYYSRTRMPASGTVTLAGATHSVRGQVWFDHQWGDFEATMLSWDWFALQLDDDTDIMLYRIRDPQGRLVIDAGTLSRGAGRIDLRAGDFSTLAKRRWTSPATGIEYPLDWQVTLPAHGYSLRVRPLLDSSEFDARTTTFNAYWEGAVEVSGSHTGQGFVELGGYALPAEK